MRQGVANTRVVASRKHQKRQLAAGVLTCNSRGEGGGGAGWDGLELVPLSKPVHVGKIDLELG